MIGFAKNVINLIEVLPYSVIVAAKRDSWRSFMFCEQCGTQIEDGKRFCQKCQNIQSHENNISSETKIAFRIGSIVFAIISTTIIFVILFTIYSRFILRLAPQSQSLSFIIIFIVSVISSILLCRYLIKIIRNKMRNKNEKS